MKNNAANLIGISIVFTAVVVSAMIFLAEVYSILHATPAAATEALKEHTPPSADATVSRDISVTIADPPAAAGVQMPTPDPDSLEAACEASRSSGKPVLAIFSAAWCEPCKKLESQALAPMRSAGKFVGVEYVKIDIDQDPDSTRRILGTARPSLPQIVLLNCQGNGCQRMGRLEGLHSSTEIEAFLQRPTEPSTSASQRTLFNRYRR